MHKQPVTCHPRSNTSLSTAIYRRWSSVQARRRSRRFPCAAFSNLPQHPGIQCGNADFLTSSGVRCGMGAYAFSKSSRKPWMRYGLTRTRIILQPAADGHGSEMLVQGALGWNKEGRRAARASSSSSGSSIKPILLAWTGANSCCAVHASRGAGSRHAPDSAGGLRGRRAKLSRRGEAQSEYKQILVPFWTGQ